MGGWWNLKIESDMHEVVYAIASTKANYNEFYQIISQCRDLLNRFSTVSLRWILRLANTVAHSLKRTTTSNASPCV